jgi:S1-C subfamily serine protease
MTTDDASGIGITVLGVFPGGKAHAAGVRAGDRIIAVNDRPVTSMQDWIDALGDGKRRVSLLRGNSFLELDFDMAIPPVRPPDLTPEG